MTVPQNPLPSLAEQAERLTELGVIDRAGISATDLRAATAPGGTGELLAVHPARVSASALVPLLSRRGRGGFVGRDLPDVDEFAAIDEVRLPDLPLYLLPDLDRGDSMAGWSPNEALPAVLARGRTPLTLVEGILWLLQQPEVLERNHCVMTIGSRLRGPTGKLDARTPALWISNGTGRDGPAHREAPKVGWCWAGNRHSWLGFASAAGRHAPAGATARSRPAAAPG